MKRFKFLPVAALVIGVAAAFLSHASEMNTVWVYANGEQTQQPVCIGAQPLCAEEYFVDSQGELQGKTGNQAFGIRP